MENLIEKNRLRQAHPFRRGRLAVCNDYISSTVAGNGKLNPGDDFGNAHNRHGGSDVPRILQGVFP